MHWFDYSVVKYMPNPKRGEVVNLGIAIFRASGIDVQLITSPNKVRFLDGLTTLKDISRLKSMLVEVGQLTQDPEEQFEFLQTVLNGVFLGAKSSFSIEDISEYDKKVKKLFNDLVKPFPSREKVPHHSRFYTVLKKQFNELGFLAKEPSEIDAHKIVPSYVLDSKSGLTADFMIKNGRYHMSEVIDFNVNDIQAKFKETSLKVITFVEGKKLFNNNLGCYFVYSATAEKETDVTSHLSLAEDYSDKLFNLESKDDKAAYFQMMSSLVGGQLNL